MEGWKHEDAGSDGLEPHRFDEVLRGRSLTEIHRHGKHVFARYGDDTDWLDPDRFMLSPLRRRALFGDRRSPRNGDRLEPRRLLLPHPSVAFRVNVHPSTLPDSHTLYPHALHSHVPMPSTKIGTSGWQHDNWAGRFYPDNVAQDDWLGFYADTFDTVEVNNTFYQSPEADTLRAWRHRTPEGFTFAIKANQYITHFKKLKDPEEPVQNLYRAVEPLGDALGPILFQCPPNWHQNLERLHTFLEILDDEHRYVLEFRDPTWLNEGTADALAAHGAAFCIYDFGDRSTHRTVTTDWVYVRLHGTGEAYHGRYSDAELDEWADAIADWRAEGRDVYVYFNNTAGEGHAPHDAQRLRNRLR